MANHESLPQVLSTPDSEQLFFSKLLKLFICSGNDDFKKEARRRIDEPRFLLGNDQKLKGTTENDTLQDLQKIEYLTIRSLDCTIISRKKQCWSCKTYRQILTVA